MRFQVRLRPSLIATMFASVKFLSVLLFCASEVSGTATEVDLRKKLFDKYDSKARPASNFSRSLVVTVRCSLVQLIQVDLLGQKIKASLWLKLGWSDDFLRWNLNEYPIEAISVPVKDVWKPDFAIYNSLKKLEHTNVDENLIVFNTGKVLVVYSIIAEVPCAMDVRAFPFDRQSCKIKMGSWTYHAGLLSLNQSSLDITTEQYTKNSEWDLVLHEGSWKKNIYECCEKWFFEDITYHLVLRRKPMYYVWNLVVPCITLLCIGIIAHFLEPNGERLNVCITTLLAFIVFLLMVPEILPPQADSVSRIALLFGLSIVLLGYSTLTTVITIYLMNQSEIGTPFKPWQRCVFTVFSKCHLLLCPKIFSRVRRMSCKEQQGRDEVMDLSSETGQHDTKFLIKLEWLAFAAGFDRFCWLLFVLGCVVNLLIFFL